MFPVSGVQCLIASLALSWVGTDIHQSKDECAVEASLADQESMNINNMSLLLLRTRILAGYLNNRKAIQRAQTDGWGMFCTKSFQEQVATSFHFSLQEMMTSPTLRTQAGRWGKASSRGFALHSPGVHAHKPHLGDCWDG